MKKYHLLLLLLAFHAVTYSQSGKITYSIKTYLDPKTEIKSSIKDYVSDLLQRANKLKYELTFNKLESSFKFIDNSMSTSKEDISARLIVSGENVFINYETKEKIIQTIDNTLIKGKYDLNEWVITKESKKIDNYLCYKATRIIRYVDRKGIRKTREIVTWFAPTLPYQFGPKDYNGLPGLILELQDANITYYATVIDLYEKPIKIHFPKGKTISKEEYEKKLKAQMGM